METPYVVTYHEARLTPCSRSNKKARQLAGFEIYRVNAYARSMYLPVRVSILIRSPVLMKSGAWTVIPVSRIIAF